MRRSSRDIPGLAAGAAFMTNAEILGTLPRKSALIIGDICLDRWCTYDPAEAEPSRETGLPRVAVVKTVVTPGAGGTVASNAIALGFGRVAVLGAVGNDGFGYELKQALQSGGIESALVESNEISTFTYTKLINAHTGEEDLPRIDFIRTIDMSASVDDAVLAKLDGLASQFDAILVSDQAETSAGGVISARIRDRLAEWARKRPQLVIWVDSRRRPHLYRNVMVKVNQDEAAAISADLEKWRNEANLPLLCVTHGPEGALVVTSNANSFVKTKPIAHPIDICGAGDSFSAGAVAALVAGASPIEAAALGNRVASITVMKPGTGTASPAEVLEARTYD